MGNILGKNVRVCVALQKFLKLRGERERDFRNANHTVPLQDKNKLSIARWNSGKGIGMNGLPHSSYACDLHSSFMFFLQEVGL